MLRLSRPWADQGLAEGTPFGPMDCLLSQAAPSEAAGESSPLMRWTIQTSTEGFARTEERLLLQHPYPRRPNATGPDRHGFPIRPRRGRESEADEAAQEALRRMNEVTARVQELGEALDDPTALWSRLKAAWDRAENEEDPRMAEIVRQARELTPVLKTLRDQIRRILRRHRELTPLDRVQEMDRPAMRWLSRQPGRNIAERAGSEQRILAVVRREDFDTLENRVAHAYLRLASDAGRDWLREHPHAKAAQRYQLVESFVKLCKSMAEELAGLGIGLATADIQPNYVLMENRTYVTVREAWERLMRREKTLDELWAWQPQTWTDFAILSLILAIKDIQGVELIAQSPIRFRSEAVTGIWFDQDRPIAVFWLKAQGRVVEVMARPEKPGTQLTLARAHVALRISDPLDPSSFPHSVAIWTPHAMERIAPKTAAEGALARLAALQRRQAFQERLRHGLILTPGHHDPETAEISRDGVHVSAIAFDAAGESLMLGREAIARFLQSDLWGAR